MSTCPPYPANVRFIEDGTEVSAAITNQPLDDLRRRTEHLKCVLDNTIFENQGIQLRNVDVTDTVVDGDFVYFNNAVLKFDEALAGTQLVGTVFLPTLSSFTVGMATSVTGVPGSKKANIIVGGEVQSIVPNDLLQLTDTFTTPGDLGVPFYLSAIDAGKITLTKPGVAVIAGYFIGATTFFVNIDIRNLGENHIHIRLELDRSVFAAVAKPNPMGALWPAGAFNYPAAILSPFPPAPPEGVVLLVNGIAYLYYQDFFIDSDGLWLTGLVPNPTIPAVTPPPPPPVDSQNYVLYYIMSAADTQAGVTTLHAGPNIEIENCIPGGPLTSGDLKIKSTSTIVELSGTAPGHIIVKDIQYAAVSDQLEIQRGPVVEKLGAGTNIALTETLPGTWRIDSAAMSTLVAPLPDISLRNAKDKILDELRSYIQFPGDGTPSGILAKIHFPGGLPAASSVEIAAQYFGEGAATIGSNTEFGFSMSYWVDSPGNNWRAPFVALAPIDLDLGAYSGFVGAKQTLFSFTIPFGTPEAVIHLRIDRRPNTAFAFPYVDNVGVLQFIYRMTLV